jgi:hypothetical protein
MNNTKQRKHVQLGEPTRADIARAIQHLQGALSGATPDDDSNPKGGGAAYAAFLLFAEGYDEYAPSLIENFDACFVGTYRDWEQARDEFLVPGGWARAQARTTSLSTLPMDYLVWDDEAVRRRLDERFQFLDSGKRIFVFARPVADLEPSD